MQCTILGSFMQSWATLDHLERGHLCQGDGAGPAVRQAPPAGEQSSREGRFMGGVVVKVVVVLVEEVEVELT